MRTKLPLIEKEILHVISYFDKYDYPPDFEDIYTYISTHGSREIFSGEIQRLVDSKEILCEEQRYSFRKEVFTRFTSNRARSTELLKKVRGYLHFLRFIPSIRLLGISGSLSMLDNDPEDDIDLFIITGEGTLWITRFIVLLYKHILQIFIPGSMAHLYCFNIYFVERDLTIKKHRRSEYVAHELFQLKPFINRDHFHEKLVKQNDWILEFFPNVQISTLVDKHSKKKYTTIFITKFIETILEKVQKMWLTRKGISYCQENGQVWLIQEGV
jgi:D-beta-D-heptose 7-phosphate kinase/D-beta-D-heptose 1-phosphate adenosyltransferase